MPTDVVARPEPRLGLALGGGGARGLCHLGVLQVLEELQIYPDVIAGTSMGGLVGAFIAAGYQAQELQRIAKDVRLSQLIDWRMSWRLVSTRALERLMEDHLPATFEELELPLVLTASNLVDGQIHYFRQGDLRTAIRATTAYPGFIEPVRLGDALLVDGGILNQLPVDGALFLGARRVIAVNATPLVRVELEQDDAAKARRRAGRETLREVFRSIDVMQAQLTTTRLSFYRPDVLLDPVMDGVEISDLHKGGIAIEAGVVAARERSEDLVRAARG
ncbi:MAG: patatin-like phospholipase family protein [Ornithinimicrobium sp.]|uniref:patatin-like phospholipase family protein n=1 Tax=Ornithinimicrobium sp. TaxID=1977084 RepID=UPI0026E049BF|nr:patatin-like phospholipase family protein [Ornithinimicrobium sp.]MDO5740523.1 patatin-like phospholipase family protein [Ornithinimicrobium sp.]